MNALQYLWLYGLTQGVNDARAEPTDKKTGEDLTSEQKVAKCQEKLDALYSGIIRRRGEAVAVDAYEAEAIREAKRHVIAVLSKAGLMKNIPKGTENRMMFVINRELTAKGKPATTESTYLATFFETKTGKAIKAQAIKTVDDRRANSSDLDEIVLGLA